MTMGALSNYGTDTSSKRKRERFPPVFLLGIFIIIRGIDRDIRETIRNPL